MTDISKEIVCNHPFYDNKQNMKCINADCGAEDINIIVGYIPVKVKVIHDYNDIYMCLDKQVVETVNAGENSRNISEVVVGIHPTNQVLKLKAFC